MQRTTDKMFDVLTFGTLLLLVLTSSQPTFAQKSVPSSKHQKQRAASPPAKKNALHQTNQTRANKLKGTQRSTPLATKKNIPNNTVKIKIPAGLRQSSLKTANTSACAYYLRTLPEVQSFASAIVVGRPLTAFLERDHYGIVTKEGPTTGQIEDGWSIGPFRIDRVLYQNAQQGVTGLAAGQTIDVAETAAIIPIGGEYSRLLIENCTELKQNSQYVVILTKESSPDRPVFYATCNLHVGRFNTDGTDQDDLTMLEYKRSLRDEIASVYGIIFVTPKRDVSIP